jgi:hypothetical protein
MISGTTMIIPNKADVHPSRARVCHSVGGASYRAGMADTKQRIGTLEMKVEQLETWAGPGQAKALATGLAAVRGDLAVLRRVQGQHTTMLTTLQADVAELKTDMAYIKTTLAEVLRRLPPASA